MGGMALNFAQLTLAYLSKDATVTMSVIYPSSAVFPVVSLCNMSPVKKTAWQSQFVSKERRTTNTENFNDSISPMSPALSANDSVSTDSSVEFSVNNVAETLLSEVELPTGNQETCSNTSIISANQKQKKRTSKISCLF